ncbi:MAG: hypothetical protein WDK96_00400 [Candidatus Paceibacterota bacterium]|jgi:hypothetical protein
MLRHIPDDIKPLRKSIRDIKKPLPRNFESIGKIRETEVKDKEDKVEAFMRRRIPSIDNLVIQEPTESRSRFLWWAIAIICFISLIFSISLLFSKAIITLEPKTFETNLNENLTATKDSQNSLSFQVMKLDAEESKIITGTTQKEVEKKATGSVIIYNNYSPSSQKLGAGTKLEAISGKIYKIDKTITIPGIKTTKGQSTPGSIEVTVTAELSGAEYNTGLTDFKIPLFKGTSKYEKFYGRSSTEIKGGFKGLMNVASDEAGQKSLTEIDQSLHEKLITQAYAQIPEGFILYEDATFINTEDLGNEAVPENINEVSVKKKGTLYAFIFNEKDLIKKITEDTVDGYDGGEVSLPLKTLVFSLKDKEKINPDTDTQISFSLTGDTKIVWKVDEQALKESLAGTKKEDFNGIMAKNTNIKSAEIIIKPFWRNVIPKDLEKIKIINNSNL